MVGDGRETSAINAVSISIATGRRLYTVSDVYLSDVCLQLVTDKDELREIHCSDIIKCNYCKEHRQNQGDMLDIVAYKLISNKRERIELKMIFGEKDMAEHWHARIMQNLHSPIPPHLKFLPKRIVLVLINPFCGQNKSLQIWENSIKHRIDEMNIGYDCIVTEYKRHGIEIGRTVNLDMYEALVILSGDGLVSEVFNGFLQRRDCSRAMKFPLLHIPTGTCNALISSVLYQCNEPFSPRGPFYEGAIAMLYRPNYLALNICSVETQKDGHKCMFLSAGWGLISDIDIGSERFRWAGLARLHMEAFLRIINLPNVARYKARISYLPVKCDKIKRCTILKHTAKREAFGIDHFKCAEVVPIGDEYFFTDDDNLLKYADISSQIRPLSEPLPADWISFEGEFVLVHITNLSHIASDTPFVPSKRLGSPYVYLMLIDWKLVRSRFEVLKLFLSMSSSGHLDYPCLQVIIARACRVEPMGANGGFTTIDGEAITNGTSFQVVPLYYSATVIGRKVVSHEQNKV